jgi:hypothetical protein
MIHVHHQVCEENDYEQQLDSEIFISSVVIFGAYDITTSIV